MTPPKSCNQNASGKGGRTDGGFTGRGGGFLGKNRGHVRRGGYERSVRLTASGNSGGGFGQDNRLRLCGGDKGTNYII